MTGRGIDQILPYSGDPSLYGAFSNDARTYVDRAEKVNGKIDYPVDNDYIWGELTRSREFQATDARIVNLETAITVSDDYWNGKPIHYRMHPSNVGVLKAARVTCCALSNNHILDWGYPGLDETLDSLDKAGIQYAGAGNSKGSAEAPTIIERREKEGRIIVFSASTGCSGVPQEWDAGENKSGVNRLSDFSYRTAKGIGENIKKIKGAGDLVIYSIHWGNNWGYDIPDARRSFAHYLIDEAGVDLIHGHSSHHIRGIEVHSGKLILYGCGDIINDCEGIHASMSFIKRVGTRLYHFRKPVRSDLGLIYYPVLNQLSGNLESLRMFPIQIRNLRINPAEEKDVIWMQKVLNRGSSSFQVDFKIVPAGLPMR